MVVLSNIDPPTEGVRFVQPQVQAFVESNDLGIGTLTVAESSVTWSKTDSGQGFSLTYPSISLHAVSRDLSNFAHECLYLMVDAKHSAARRDRRRPQIHFADVTDDLASIRVSGNDDPAPNGDLNADQNGGEDGTESDDDDEETGMVEIRYVPVDKSVLDQIFEVMSDCQALHPDEEDDFSDEEEEGVDGDAAMMGDMMAMGDGQFFTSADDVVELNEEGQANLRRILQGSNGQGG
uniref:Methylosome subunit pICln n=1 Tax=Plectus sambesii TaxID=2011161 RepID=A0A914VUG7_9BILA